MQQYFHNLIASQYRIHHKIYTDGSVEDSSAGCGISSSNASCSIKLPDNTTIFSAEAIAIYLAAEETTVDDRPNVIFTDSASVLKALEKGSMHQTDGCLLDRSFESMRSKSYNKIKNWTYATNPHTPFEKGVTIDMPVLWPGCHSTAYTNRMPWVLL
uniref:RNase H type-1 domain-containing protein n=1 Tax=Anopheles stephensi TaxID=30069 RepID=A0A182Y134_ANOST